MHARTDSEHRGRQPASRLMQKPRWTRRQALDPDRRDGGVSKTQPSSACLFSLPCTTHRLRRCQLNPACREGINIGHRGTAALANIGSPQVHISTPSPQTMPLFSNQMPSFCSPLPSLIYKPSTTKPPKQLPVQHRPFACQGPAVPRCVCEDAAQIHPRPTPFPLPPFSNKTYGPGQPASQPYDEHAPFFHPSIIHHPSPCLPHACTSEEPHPSSIYAR